MGNGTRKEKEKEGPFSFSILCQVRRAGQGIWTLITLLAMHRPSPLEMLMIYAWLILTRILTAAPATATAMDPSVDGDDETTRIGVTWGKRASKRMHAAMASMHRSSIDSPFFPRGFRGGWADIQVSMQDDCTCSILSMHVHPSIAEIHGYARYRK
jgi:hypothetical protein